MSVWQKVMLRDLCLQAIGSHNVSFFKSVCNSIQFHMQWSKLVCIVKHNWQGILVYDSCTSFCDSIMIRFHMQWSKVVVLLNINGKGYWYFIVAKIHSLLLCLSHLQYLQRLSVKGYGNFNAQCLAILQITVLFCMPQISSGDCSRFFKTQPIFQAGCEESCHVSGYSWFCIPFS